MPDFVEPQLAKLVDEPPRGSQWVHEIKFDGYRVQARIENGKCVMGSRKALDYSKKFPEIAAACGELPNCITDGEVCAVDNEGVPNFAGLQKA
jgi:bifunctional non-homologous end joining protein LigD